MANSPAGVSNIGGVGPATENVNVLSAMLTPSEALIQNLKVAAFGTTRGVPVKYAPCNLTPGGKSPDILEKVSEVLLTGSAILMVISG
jgi:hypothetical protein